MSSSSSASRRRALELGGAAHREHRSADRKAAVGVATRAPRRSPRAQVIDHGDLHHPAGIGRIAILLGPGPDGEHRPCWHEAAGGRSPDGASARRASVRVGRAPPRTPPGAPPRACGRLPRPAWSRAGGSPRAAHDHAQERVARQAQVAHATPHDRVIGRDRVLEDLGPEAADGAGLGERPRQRRLVRRHADGARQAARAWRPGGASRHDGEEDDVEEAHAVSRTSAITGKIASTIGTAPRRPAQPSTSLSGQLNRTSASIRLSR